MSEQNIKQAHAAYEQLTDFVTKAMGAWTGALPANPTAQRIQGCARSRCGNSEEECRLAFALVEKIAKAQNFQEILTLQTQFAQDQMQAFTTQTQELYKLIGEALQKLQHS